MRKGLKLLRFGVPIDRRTLAPAPSACSTARKTFRIARGTDMLLVAAGLIFQLLCSRAVIVSRRCSLKKSAETRATRTLDIKTQETVFIGRRLQMLLVGEDGFMRDI